MSVEGPAGRAGRAEPGRPQRGARDEAAAAEDLALVERMRQGRAEAYDELYRRHAEAVRRYARTCCRDADTAEDLTNEVFAATLQAVQGGAGPGTAVRAYLLTSVRRVAADWARTARRERLVADFAAFAVSAAAVDGGALSGEDAVDQGADVRAMRDAERSLAVRAFRSLPERWQTVLWHTAIEDSSPREVAPLLGLTPNAAAALAHRAREGLKQAYLQAHVSRALTQGGDCARYADRLGAHARGGLRARAERGLRRHLEECPRCASAAVEVRDLNRHIRAVLPVAVVGWFAVASWAEAGWLALGTAGAGTAARAGAAGGTAGGTAGGAAGGCAGEGLGGAVKAGTASGVVATAVAAVMALVIVDGAPEREQPPPREDKPQAAAPAPERQEPEPPAPVREDPGPEPEREAEAVAGAGSVKPMPAAEASLTPVPMPAPEPPEPGTTPGPTIPEPAPEPEPVAEPEPEPEPEPGPEAGPEAERYELYGLAWDIAADGDEPALRLRDSSPVWRRDGVSVAGREYEHGITVPSPSSVVIDLNRECLSYQALTGIDDLSPRAGEAVFSVYGDGERLWRSEVTDPGRDAVALNVPLTGVEALRLVVEPRGMLDEGGTTLADWAESEIVCG